jgi:predicted dinucleotide-binding enzyme
VRALATDTGATAASPLAAAAAAEIAVLALPWAAAETAVRGLGCLEGKAVVACMGPILRTAAGIGLAVGHGTSGGQIVQDWLPRAHVVGTLAPVGAEILADTGRLPCPAVMFVAGNDARSQGCRRADAGRPRV